MAQDKRRELVKLLAQAKEAMFTHDRDIATPEELAALDMEDVVTNEASRARQRAREAYIKEDAYNPAYPEPLASLQVEFANAKREYSILTNYSDALRSLIRNPWMTSGTRGADDHPWQRHFVIPEIAETQWEALKEGRAAASARLDTLERQIDAKTRAGTHGRAAREKESRRFDRGLHDAEQTAWDEAMKAMPHDLETTVETIKATIDARREAKLKALSDQVKTLMA